MIKTYQLYTKYKIKKILLLFSCVIILTCVSCSNIPRGEIKGIEHLDCSPSVKFISRKVTCEQRELGDWVKCTSEGIVTNIGTGIAYNVVIWIEYGKEYQGVRSSAFKSLGDINPGENKEYSHEFDSYEWIETYDITIKCKEYS